MSLRVGGLRGWRWRGELIFERVICALDVGRELLAYGFSMWL